MQTPYRGGPKQKLAESVGAPAAPFVIARGARPLQKPDSRRMVLARRSFVMTKPPDTETARAPGASLLPSYAQYVTPARMDRLNLRRTGWKASDRQKPGRFEQDIDIASLLPTLSHQLLFRRRPLSFDKNEITRAVLFAQSSSSSLRHCFVAHVARLHTSSCR